MDYGDDHVRRVSDEKELPVDIRSHRRVSAKCRVVRASREAWCH